MLKLAPCCYSFFFWLSGGLECHPIFVDRKQASYKKLNYNNYVSAVSLLPQQELFAVSSGLVA